MQVTSVSLFDIYCRILTKLVHSRWTGAAVVLYLGLKLFSQDPRTKAQEAEEKILKCTHE